MTNPSPISYPIHLNLSNRLCVVIGGGEVALRKVRSLIEAGGKVRVISPEAHLDLEALETEGAIERERATYSPLHLEGAFLVFAATNRTEVNLEVVKEANRLGVLVNSADAPEAGDFVTPSVIRRGALCLSVTTGGSSPMLSARISRELEERFGVEYEVYLELLGAMRSKIKSHTSNPTYRKQLLSALLKQEPRLLSLLREGKRDEAERLAQSVLE